MGDDLASLTRPSAWPASSALTGPRHGGKELGARLLAFAIPVLIAIEVPGVGTIYLAELCLIGLLPVLVVMRGRMLQSKALAFILCLGLLYFGAQVITDVIRETPFADYARGWSRILFLLFSFVSTYLLIGNDRAKLLCYAGGLVVGATLFVLINNPLANIGWKFGFAGPTTTLILIGFSLIPILRSPRSLVGPGILVALGIFSAFMDFRSWGGILMVSAAFLSMPALLRLFGMRPKPLSYGRMLVIGTVLLATGFGAIKLYGAAAESGLLGERSRQKYETQSALGDLGILLGGRSESLVTVQAIQDSPLIGHGSWAKDRHYAELRQLMLYRLGFVNRFIEPETDHIPTHSHLLGSWVEAGIAGAAFWVGILFLILAAIRRLYASEDPLRPYLVFLMFLFVWDILFSPFGAQRRLTNGFLMVAMLFALKTTAMTWRQRQASMVPPFAANSFGVSQALDPVLRPGLAETPDPAAWPSRAFERTAIEADLDDDLNAGMSLDGDPDVSAEASDLPAEIADIETADIDDVPSVDDDDAFERAGEQEVLREGPDDDDDHGSETIRAGFRRIRQRDA